MPVSASGQEMPYAGTPEMDALLQQVNQNPQMLAVVGQEPALLAEIMKHVGLNVEEQQLRDIVDTWPDEAAEASMGEDADAAEGDVEDTEAAPEEVASAPPTTDENEEGYDEFTKPPDGSVPLDDEDADVQAASAPTSNRSTPMPRRGGGNPIDDLISAQMMQSAVGNPNAPVPTGGQVGRQMRPAIPASRAPSSGASERQQMIAEIFRNQGKSTKKKKADA